ncbi:MAG: hypothetical protein QM608_20150 [Caulobacter sp.]
MDSLFSPALALHVACGFAAVAAGLVPLLSRKGSRLHRLSGRVYAALMGTLLAAAWVMTILRFSAYFAALSATASIGLFSGLRVLGRKRPDLDPTQRARPLDWAAALAVIAVGAWVVAQLLTGASESPRMPTLALAYAAFAFGGWDLWRFARPTDRPFSPDLWTYEHLAKMLCAYGAVISAFSGNFLTFLPTPWSQLWPTLLFQPLAMGWIAVLVVRRRRLCSPA